MKTNFRGRTGLSALDLLLLADPATRRADNLFVANTASSTITEFKLSGVGTVFRNGLRVIADARKAGDNLLYAIDARDFTRAGDTSGVLQGQFSPIGLV